MGSCIAKDPKSMGKIKKGIQQIKKTDTTGTIQQKNSQKYGIKNSQSQKVLSFNHAALRFSQFLFNKFKNSDSKPEQVNLGFMLNKCMVDVQNKQILINYMNSAPITIWVVYGGIEKVSQTGLTVQIKDYKHMDEIRLTQPTSNNEQGDCLPPIDLPQQPKDTSTNSNIDFIHDLSISNPPSVKRVHLNHPNSPVVLAIFQNQRHLWFRACSVCLTNKSQCILLPCRHMCVCASCLEYIEKTKPNCPLCRKEYYSVVKYGSASQ